MNGSIGHNGWRTVWVLAALGLLSACGEEATKLTQIVVVIDSDLSVPARLDNVQIEVSGTKEPRVIDAPVDTDQHKLPRSLGLVYSGGPLGPMRVIARGQLAGATVVERVADVYFKKDRTLKLALPLTRSCADHRPECASEQTCNQGECVPIAMSLPAFHGDDGPLFPDASSEWAADGGAGDAGFVLDADGGPDAGHDAGPEPSPTCVIDAPSDGAKFYAGDEVAFVGSCTWPDGKRLNVRWQSTLHTKLGSGSPLTKNNLALGIHEISLCANGTNTCTTRQIEVQALPPLSAAISSLSQEGASGTAYVADAELVAVGTATGVPPIALAWIDSLAGKVTCGATCTFSAPMLPGRHLLRLEITDGRGRKTRAERSFVVRAPGHESLFETYDVANSVLSTSGTVTALASDGDFHYVGTEAGYLLKVEAEIPESMSPSVTPTALSEPRPEVRSLFVHVSSNTLYLATSADVQSCDVTNGIVKNCAKLTLGNFASAMPRCVRRLSHEGSDFLVVGTSAGLWVGANNMLDNGNLRETSAEFHAMTESAGKLWFAGSAGLSAYTLGSGGGLSGTPNKFAGAPSALSAIVASGNFVWPVPSSGITRYDVGMENWTSWTTASTGSEFGRLVSNDVRSIAITHPVIDGAAHDVIWVGTGAGLSRFDPEINSFTSYTESDGLPDNSILRVVALPSNELLLATPSGLAIHRGR